MGFCCHYFIIESWRQNTIFCILSRKRRAKAPAWCNWSSRSGVTYGCGKWKGGIFRICIGNRENRLIAALPTVLSCQSGKNVLQENREFFDFAIALLEVPCRFHPILQWTVFPCGCFIAFNSAWISFWISGAILSWYWDKSIDRSSAFILSHNSGR